MLPVSGLEPRQPDRLEQLPAEQVAGHDPRQPGPTAQVLKHTAVYFNRWSMQRPTR